MYTFIFMHVKKGFGIHQFKLLRDAKEIFTGASNDEYTIACAIYDKDGDVNEYYINEDEP